MKTKKNGWRYLREDLRYRFELDWWLGLGPALGDGKNKKYIFPVSGIFSGKAVSVTLLGFEYTINLQNLIKIVGVIFEKIKFFFLCELPLILGVGEN